MDFRSPARRIQFQKGLGIQHFLKRFGTEAQCRDALFCGRWPRGFVCPCCGSHRHWKLGRPLIRCAECRAEISLTSGTLFHCTKLPLTTWFLAIYLMTQTKTGMSIPEMKRHLQVNEKTAWLIQHKLMEAMRVSEHRRVLSGCVALGTPVLRKRPGTGRTGQPDRQKVECILAIQTDPDGALPRVCLKQVASFRPSVIQNWALMHLAPGTRILGDGSRNLAGITRSGYELVIRRSSRSHGQESSPGFWLKTLIGNFRTALSGVRHLELNRYPDRYMSLFQFRLNHRMDLAGIASRLIECSIRTGARTRWMLSQVENHGKSGKGGSPQAPALAHSCPRRSQTRPASRTADHPAGRTPSRTAAPQAPGSPSRPPEPPDPPRSP
jgi:hypothetical protein